jgi:hypothetical protein
MHADAVTGGERLIGRLPLIEIGSKQYHQPRYDFDLLVVTARLIVGIAVPAANTTPFLCRYGTMPLAWTIIYKAGV